MNFKIVLLHITKLEYKCNFIVCIYKTVQNIIKIARLEKACMYEFANRFDFYV